MKTLNLFRVALALSLTLALTVAPVKAQTQPPLAAQIAKVKSIYLSVRTADQKAFAALRSAINTSTLQSQISANEAVFTTAAKVLNSEQLVIRYAIENKIHETAFMKTVFNCFFSIDYKYRDLVEKIFNDEVYLLDAEEDAEQIDEDIFASSNVESQLKDCGEMEKQLGSK